MQTQPSPTTDSLHQVAPTIITGLKYQWMMPSTDDAAAQTLACAHNLSIPITHVLCNRGYRTSQDINAFLFSSIEKDVTHPRVLTGTEDAASRILKAIDYQEKILIFGDYDVDGITASSLLLAALIPLGAHINYFLPSRQKDGYGLSVNAVVKAHRSGYHLIITVDNGITAIEAAAKAYDLGIDLIITDHHRPHNQLPKALAIINPNQPNCTYPFKDLAGVGVIFKLISLIYEQKGITTLPTKLYELLMLGTIADIAPLVGENRFWVRYGLAQVTQQPSLALSLLANNVNLYKKTYSSLDISFMIAPQINALGRMSNPREAVKFLISSDQSEVERIGQILKTMNEERKKLEQVIYEEIEGAIINKSINLTTEHVIVAASKTWPPGIIGLVAGKLMQNYGRPTLLFHLDDGIAKGSCRSIPEFNIFDALQANQDLLINFGGHSLAAGLKVTLDNLPKLKERLEQQLLSVVSPLDLVPKLTLDAPVQLPELNGKCWADLEQLEPFGNQNPQPLFLIKNVTLLRQPTLLKDKHVKCTIFSQGIIKPVIFFNRPDLFTILSQVQDKSFHLAAYITKNEWEGATHIELQGIDMAVD
jgi:single-stranded-DNA-specific exonuclease